MTDKQLIIKTVVSTLRHMCWLDSEDEPTLAEAAAEVEHWVKTFDDPTEWCCPLCQELICDEHCPLAPVRARS